MLMKELKKISDLNIIHIDFPSMNKIDEYFFKLNDKNIFKIIKSNGNISINPNILKYIQYFPMFFLFPTDQWNNLSILPPGLVFNGNISPNGEITRIEKPIAATAMSLESWVKGSIDNLKQNPIIPTTPKTLISPAPAQLPGYLSPSKIKMRIVSRPTE
jgi:hypothetical protein